MSLTRKIGAYLCTAAMVFSLNVKSNALVKEILQIPGMLIESALAVMLWHEVIKKDNKDNKDNDSKGVCAAFGTIFAFDAVQRAYYLVFGDGNSKAEKTDNKEANKKNEKKDLNA